MSQHLKDSAITGPCDLQWSKESSAFFKPIVMAERGESSKTDEEKSHNLIKPTPMPPSILLNDSEMRLPVSPPFTSNSLFNRKLPFTFLEVSQPFT